MLQQEANTGQVASMPPRFVVAGGGSPAGAAIFCCPVCGHGNCHIGPVVVAQGKTKAIVENESVRTVASDRHERRRGSQVALTFLCEDGHAFVYLWDFHKGVVSLSLESAHSDDVAFSALWRD